MAKSIIRSNKILVKLRVNDSNGNIVGESGILKSGQYVEYLDIDGINIGDEYINEYEMIVIPELFCGLEEKTVKSLYYLYITALNSAVLLIPLNIHPFLLAIF